jgi:hypothetical protein
VTAIVLKDKENERRIFERFDVDMGDSLRSGRDGRDVGERVEEARYW